MWAKWTRQQIGEAAEGWAMTHAAREGHRVIVLWYEREKGQFGPQQKKVGFWPPIVVS